MKRFFVFWKGQCVPGNGLGMLLLVLLFTAWSPTVSAKPLKYAIVLGTDKWYHAIDENGRIVADSLRPQSEQFYVYNIAGEGMFPFVREGKLGFKNHRNQVMVPPAYRPVTYSKLRSSLYVSGSLDRLEQEILMTRFQYGQAVVLSVSGNFFGVVDNRGRQVVDTVYDYIGPAQPNGVRPARRGDTLFLLDKRGRNILPFPYRCDPALNPVPRFGDGLLAVMIRVGGFPYRDFSGEEQGRFTEGNSLSLSPEQVHNYKVGFVNASGHLVIDTIFRLQPHMLNNREHDRRVALMSGGMCGTGRRNLASAPRPKDPYYLQSKDFYVFTGGRCLVSKGRDLFAINLNGDSLYAIPSGRDHQNIRGNFVIDQRSSFISDGVFVLNRAGKMIVPFKEGNLFVSFEGEITDGGEGFFRMQKGSYSGVYFMDSNGRNPFRDTFQQAYPFYNGFAEVILKARGQKTTDDDLEGAIDAQGRFWPDSVGSPARGGYGLFITPGRDAKRYRILRGMRNKAGKWVIPQLYEELQPFAAGLAAFKDAETRLWGYLRPDGSIAIAAQYQEPGGFVEAH